MSSVKKSGRRRTKKQIIDEQDLKNAQQIQSKHEDKKGKLNQHNDNLFDTAKLDKNYFVRRQNKSNPHESDIMNLDEQEENQYDKPSDRTNTIQKNSQAASVKQPKPTTDKKRRRKPNKQNIFDQEDRQNPTMMESSQTGQKHTDQKLPKQNQYNYEELPSGSMGKKLFNQSKDDSQDISDDAYISPKTLNYEQKREDRREQTEQIRTYDEGEDEQFDKIIKKEKQKDLEYEQKIFYLHKEINKFSNQDKKQFYFEPLPPNTVAYGYFKRFSSGLSEIYQLAGQDHRPLLFCQNQRGCIGSNYYISMTKQMDKNKPSYLGKLRGNAAGSTYFLYDNGIQPTNQIDRSQWRITMAAIQYKNNFMGMNGPRKLKVTTPSAKLLLDADTFKLSEQQSLLNFKPPVVSEYRNKTPKWNEKLSSYALNFGGRVKLASIKNFILIGNQYEVEGQEEADSMVVFGKIDQNTFSVEYRHPLSLFQAFGIVMSQFDFKINCQ